MGLYQSSSHRQKTLDFLIKYTTKQLVDMLNKNVADGGMKDEGKAKIVFKILNLLYQRQRVYSEDEL